MCETGSALCWAAFSITTFEDFITDSRHCCTTASSQVILLQGRRCCFSLVIFVCFRTFIIRSTSVSFGTLRKKGILARTKDGRGKGVVSLPFSNARYICSSSCKELLRWECLSHVKPIGYWKCLLKINGIFAMFVRKFGISTVIPPMHPLFILAVSSTGTIPGNSEGREHLTIGSRVLETC